MTAPTTRYALKIVCVADGSATPLAGRYVRRWHPSASHPGLPMIDAVSNPAGARTFATWTEALDYWQGVNRKHPVRPDGRPNRPMTAYTCEVVPIP